MSYDRPVKLAVGMGSAALDRRDSAAADLSAALAWSRTQHAAPFLVEAAVELAGVLARRAGPGDTASAGAFLDEAGTVAAQLQIDARSPGGSSAFGQAPASVAAPAS